MSVYFFRERKGARAGFRRAWLVTAVVLTAVWGCSRHEPVARIERLERGTALYREAIAEEQAGNLDEAIRLLKQLLADEPQIYSAHFQLATLLHDYAKDYVGAIHHYIAYLELRPESEKATTTLPIGSLGKDAGKSVGEMRTLIQERIRRAKELLAPQLLTELGDSVEGVSQAHLMRENERLNGQIKTLTVEKSALAREKEDAVNLAKGFQSEAERLRRLLNQMKVDMEGEAKPAARKSPVRTETPERATESAADRRSDLKRLREEAESLGREVAKPDGPETPVAAGNRSKPQPLPKPEIPKTPVVKASDLSALKREALAEIEKEKNAREKPTAPEKHPADPKPVDEKPAEATPAAPEGGDVQAPADARETLNALLGRGSKRETKKSEESMRVYVVQPGDTLFRVAERFYGDTTKWKKIRDANRTRIDPDGRIRAGQSILIP